VWVAPIAPSVEIIGGGLNVPPVEIAQAQPVVLPAPPAAVVREEEARKARVPVVRPRKQARH
jgi:hypothetical protein